MSGPSIDLEQRLASYRAKIPKLAQHLNGLDDAQRSAFRYKGLPLSIGTAERPLLAMAKDGAEPEPWQQRILDTVALALLWADLSEARRKHEASGGAGALGAVVRRFSELARDHARGLDAERADGTRAKQLAIAAGRERLTALLEAAAPEEELEEVDEDNPLARALVFDPPAPRASRPAPRAAAPAAEPRPEAEPARPKAVDLDGHLEPSRAELARLLDLPGLGATALGLRAGGTEWYLTRAEGDALCGRAAPEHPRSEAITRLLSLTASATFQLGRDHGWLLAPEQLEVSRAQELDERGRAHARTVVARLLAITDETACRAQSNGDPDLYQLVTPVAARFQAIARAVAGGSGRLPEPPSTGPLACTLTADDLAEMPSATAKPLPQARPPETRAAEAEARSVDAEASPTTLLDDDPYARELMAEATRTAAVSGKKRGKKRDDASDSGERVSFGLVAASSTRGGDRSVRAGRIMAALAVCAASVGFLALETARAYGATGPGPVSAIAHLEPDVPSLSVQASEETREATVLVNVEAWTPIALPDRERRIAAACELLAANGYTAARFLDARGEELASWSDGRVEVAGAPDAETGAAGAP